MEAEETKIKHRSLYCLIKALSFMLVFTLLLLMASQIFMPKKVMMQSTSARGFYGEPKNSIDVLVIGNSNAYSGFSPMELWKGNGYTSYVSGEGNQDISQAYYLLREALTCQSPKLVILETDEIFQKNHNILESAIDYNVQQLLPIIGYHTRWKTLNATDFTKKPLPLPWQSNSKGFSISTKAEGYTGKEYMVPNKSTVPIDSVTQYFLDQFVSLCKERHIQLLFVDVPCAVEWNYTKHNTVSAYADTHQILFLDMNLNRSNFGFNWVSNTRDKGDHLNVSGAQKVTSYLGQYISKNFKISNHAKDAAYQRWNKDLADYEKKIV